MRGFRSIVLGLSLCATVTVSARAQASLHPTILIDGHVALDTILSISMTKSIHAALTDMLRGTGVGLATLFSPDADMAGKPFTGEIGEVVAAEHLHRADIVLEMNAMQSQNGTMYLAPTIILRHGPAVDMAPVSGLNAEAIAKTIANRIVKDSTRIRRLAADDARADSLGGGKPR
ncbi:MAG: hypothetical protein ABI442_07650 [Gemmatimonadaceae bacterium]